MMVIVVLHVGSQNIYERGCMAFSAPLFDVPDDDSTTMERGIERISGELCKILCEKFALARSVM